MIHPRTTALVVALLAAGCASARPARPLSAAQHEAAARNEEALAARQAARFDPSATEERKQCTALGPQKVASEFDLCLPAVENPTAKHLRQAEEHDRRAAEHRAESAALRAAADGACAGLPPGDRDVSPFERAAAIEEVAALGGEDDGAVVTFRQEPGLTAGRLAHQLACHQARYAALGRDAPGAAVDPIAPAGVEARVSQGGGVLEVELTADEPATAKEVLDRAERLIEGRSP